MSRLVLLLLVLVLVMMVVVVMYGNVTILQTPVTFRTAFSCISTTTIYSTFLIMHIPSSRIFQFSASVVSYKQWTENAWLDNDWRSMGHTLIDWYALEFWTFWKISYNACNKSRYKRNDRVMVSSAETSQLSTQQFRCRTCPQLSSLHLAV